MNQNSGLEQNEKVKGRRPRWVMFVTNNLVSLPDRYSPKFSTNNPVQLFF